MKKKRVRNLKQKPGQVIQPNEKRREKKKKRTWGERTDTGKKERRSIQPMGNKCIRMGGGEGG